MTNLPLVDLVAQYQSLECELQDALLSVARTAGFIGGPSVVGFEAEFAAFTQAEHCIGVGNGTDAIHLALRAGGIGGGDEVIVPVNTFIATAEAVSMAGATPVFVDVDAATLQIDVEAAAAACTPATAAIVPVHLFGHPADMTRIMELATERGLFVCEDTAQAHGAIWCGRQVGTFGNAGTYSFYPGKNLGAFGDAGAVVTNNAALAEDVRRLANHGRFGHKYLHDRAGYNSRLDAIQAAVLRVKLGQLAAWNERRRAVAALYDEALSGIAVVPLTVAEDATPVFHLYVVHVRNRDRVQADLRATGIATGVHYPVPLHLQPAYGSAGNKGEFAVAEAAAETILSLPMFPEMTSSDVERVAEALRQSSSA